MTEDKTIEERIREMLRNTTDLNKQYPLVYEYICRNVLALVRQELSSLEQRKDHEWRENEEYRLRLVAEQEKIAKQKGYVTDTSKQYIHALDWTHDMLRQTQPSTHKDKENT